MPPSISTAKASPFAAFVRPLFLKTVRGCAFHSPRASRRKSFRGWCTRWLHGALAKLLMSMRGTHEAAFLHHRHRHGRRQDDSCCVAVRGTGRDLLEADS